MAQAARIPGESIFRSCRVSPVPHGFFALTASVPSWWRGAFWVPARI